MMHLTRFLSYNDASYSLSLWVQPILRQGTIGGSSLGYDPLYFASNESLIARVGSTLISFNMLLQLEPIWSHIVLTCSSSNGLKLYVNNQLVGTVSLVHISRKWNVVELLHVGSWNNYGKH